jgi:predicted amidohydrolase
MKVYFVSRGKVEDFNKQDAKDCEIIVFGFGAIAELNYKKELKGESEELVKIGRLSKECNATVICGTETENYGIKRLSAIVADRGKIIGIADMNSKNTTCGYSSGGGYKIINTPTCKIGVLVAEDLYCVEAVKSMSLCETDLIIAIYPNFSDSKPTTVARAYSLLFGVPIGICSTNFSLATAINGDVLFSSPTEEISCEIPTKKVYREITLKQRGIQIE